MSIFQEQIPMLLLTIFIILFIFCIMQKFMYTKQSIKYSHDDHVGSHTNSNMITLYDLDAKTYDINGKINKEISILFTMIEQNTKKKLKENFTIDTSTLQNYNANLGVLQTYLATYQSTDLQNIKNIMKTVNDTALVGKQQILDLLTNIYMMRYLENINQINATTYKEFLKYEYPSQNKFYKQYQ